MRKRDRILGVFSDRSARGKVNTAIRPLDQASPSKPATQPQVPPEVAPPTSTSCQPSTSAPETDLIAPKDANQALQLAIQRHSEELSDSEKAVFLDTFKQITNDQILAIVKAYDDDHRHQSKYRAKAELVSRFLSLLDRFLGILGLAGQNIPDVGAIAIGGVRVIIDIAVRFFSFFGKLCDMIDRLGNYLEPLSQYAKDAGNDKLVCETLANVYGDILQFFRRARRVFVDEKGTTRTFASFRIFFRIQWIPFEDEFGTIELSLKHHLDVLQHSVQGKLLSVTIQNETRRQQQEAAKEREDFLAWLSGIPFETVQDNTYARKHEQTGQWLLETDQFQSWLNSPHTAALWCYGKPGAGKSVLASNVIEFLTCALGEDMGMCFAYYDYRNSELDDAAHIIRALIKQLCLRTKSLPASFLKVKQDGMDPSQLGNLDYFIQAGQDFSGGVFLVIDGLDECSRERRHEVFAFLLNVVEKLSLFKLFVTSRYAIDIADAFEDLHAPVLKIEAKNVTADVKVYVEHEIKTLRTGHKGKKLHIKDNSLEKLIIEDLSSKADGMFLWVNLQISRLCKISECRRDSEIRAALLSLPTGINETYLRIMDQIMQQEEYMKNLAIRTFRWVLFAQRPLTSEELREAVFYKDSDSQSEPDDISILLEACANLLVEELYPDYFEDGTIIRPLHFSLVELLTEPFSQFEAIPFITSIGTPPEGNSKLARACMTYLREKLEQLGPVFKDDLRPRIFDLPLAWYAASNFDHHLLCCRGLSADLKEAIQSWIDLPSSFLGSVLQLRSVPPRELAYIPNVYSLEIPNATDDWLLENQMSKLVFSSNLCNLEELQSEWKEIKPLSSSLSRAIIAGIPEGVHRLIQTGVDINELVEYARGFDGPYFISPIELAARKGNQQIASILIQAGAKLHGSQSKWGSALQAAADVNTQNDLMIQLLLDNGADVNATSGDYGNALQAAASNGNEKNVQKLLESGADINASGGHYGNALQAAASNGHEWCLQKLLDLGVDVNVTGGEYGTALGAASCRGHLSVIQKLLENGADIHIRDGENRSVLEYAVGKNPYPWQLHDHLKAVRILIENGAVIDRALHFASRIPHCEDVMELLIEYGADINARDADLGTPIEVALRGRNMSGVNFLIIKGAKKPPSNSPGSRETRQR